MRNWKTLHGRSFRLLLVLVGSFLASPARMSAQGTTIHPAALGEKAVWEKANNIVGSAAVVDASGFCTIVAGSPCAGPNGSGGVDFCAVLQYALNHMPSNVSSAGVVVDTRGIVPGRRSS